MTTLPSPAEALREAVATIGSQSAAARLLGVTQAAVSIWLRDGRHLPAGHVLTVERASGMPRQLLRPDLYPTEESELR